MDRSRQFLPGRGVRINHRWKEHIMPFENPNGMTAIDKRAFYENDELTSVAIPKGVTSIGYAAFSGCPCEESVKTQFRK